MSLQYTHPHSLNQGQGSIFTLRECAESISRIKLPLKGHFLEKNFSDSESRWWPPQSGIVPIFLTSDPLWGNFMRGIDCAHRKILKKFSGVLGLKLITPNFYAIFFIFCNFFQIRKKLKNLSKIEKFIKNWKIRK